MAQLPPIETERLVLRLPTRDDVPAIVAYYSQNREHLQPWSPTWPQDILTQEFWRRDVVRRQAEYSAGLSAAMFLFEKADGQRLVGNLSLTQIVRGAAHYCMLGYGLAADAQGNGYMLEAVRGAVRFAFGGLRLHRVMAGYVPRNRRSARVLRRAGFEIEGYARAYLCLNGRWEDHVLTAITNWDWEG